MKRQELTVGTRVTIPAWRDYPAEIGVVQYIVQGDAYVVLVRSSRIAGWHEISTLRPERRER